MNTEFKGIFPYLVSPMNADGTVKESSLRRLVEHLIACGVHGLTPLGSTGEFYYLTWEQRREIVRIVVEQTAGRVPVVAGVACSSVYEAQRQTREFEAMGVDGILAVLNVYFPLKQDEIYDYFAAVADSTSLPVVLYNNPKFTGFEIALDTLNRLSRIDNVLYYKDASSNTGRLFQLTNAVEGRMKIFSASAHVPLFVMMMGGAGWMAGPACVLPKESVRLYELCSAQKWDDAMVLQRKLWDINRVFQKYNLAACIKAALNLQGFDVDDPIPPLRPLGREAVEDIAGVLERIQGVRYPLP